MLTVCSDCCDSCAKWSTENKASTAGSFISLLNTFVKWFTKSAFLCQSFDLRYHLIILACLFLFFLFMVGLIFHTGSMFFFLLWLKSSFPSSAPIGNDFYFKWWDNNPGLNEKAYPSVWARSVCQQLRVILLYFFLFLFLVLRGRS